MTRASGGLPGTRGRLVPKMATGFWQLRRHEVRQQLRQREVRQQLRQREVRTSISLSQKGRGRRSTTLHCHYHSEYTADQRILRPKTLCQAGEAAECSDVSPQGELARCRKPLTRFSALSMGGCRLRSTAGSQAEKFSRTCHCTRRGLTARSSGGHVPPPQST